MIKILAFAGSLRKDSINKKLINYSAKMLEKLGAEVKVVDIADYELPVYNPDISANEFPENAKKLASLMSEYKVWLVSTPEYNYSIPGALKNLIDLVSRSPDNQPNVQLFNGKIIALMSASPSAFGGYRALRQLREIFSSLGTFVIPSNFSLAKAYEAFDLNDDLAQESDKKILEQTLSQLVEVSKKII